MYQDARIFIAGHRGMVGSALVRKLRAGGYTNLILRTRQELDLREQGAVNAFFAEERPEYVFLAAAKVGGIVANSTYPADFISDNLAIQTNVITAAHAFHVTKLLFLGSSCIYPKHAPQPMSESLLLTGPLEPTSEPYAIAKIAGIKLCEALARQHGCRFITLMPCTLYGPNDNFDPKGSHVLPALVRKFDAAAREHKQTGVLPVVELWGSGAPRREFMFVDDFADACLFLMECYEDSALLNVGVGDDLSIRELAGIVAEVTSFRGEVRWDLSKPDGTPRKLLDVARLSALGWRPTTSFEEGLQATYAWYQSNRSEREDELCIPG